MNEFVSISELRQSRKDKINSKDITERYLFSLFDSSVMLQIAEIQLTSVYSQFSNTWRMWNSSRWGVGVEVGKNIKK